MNIEFNTRRITGSAAAQPVGKSKAAAATGDTVSLGNTGALKAAISNIPLVRPEKVDAARAAVSGTVFPPDEVLKAVASLLAEKMR
jgi:hypothetical protein